jgi:SAM-dependent methyltransferase
MTAWREPLARCAHCGTAVTLTEEPSPRAPSAPAPRAGADGDAAPRAARLAAPLLAAFDRSRLRRLRRAAPPPARLVDAGAGRGRFVAAARRAGYDASGFEPDPGRAAAARAYGVELDTTAIEDATYDPGSVDAVTAWHVLEHVEDPDAAVAALAGWLRPGGALLVGVPNLASLQAWLAGSRWYHLDLRSHRTHFTPAGLHALLRRHGLQVVATHHLLAEHNPFGMWQSLVSQATRRPSYLFRWLRREAPFDPFDLGITLLSAPLLPVAALLELAAGAARRGGTIAVLAKRRG